MLFADDLLMQSEVEALPGQFAYTRTTNGSVTTTVPDGVFEVSLACIGEGGDAARFPDTPLTRTGGGGQTAYNTIAVTPGELLTFQRTSTRWQITVLRDGSQLVACAAQHASDQTAGSGGLTLTGLLATMQRFDGGAGYVISSAAARGSGASPGSYGRPGQNGASSSSTTVRGGQGNTLLGGDPTIQLTRGGGTSAQGQDYGGGGAVSGSTSYTVGQGADGGARAIWGKVNGILRRYPNTYTEDII